MYFFICSSANPAFIFVSDQSYRQLNPTPDASLIKGAGDRVLDRFESDSQILCNLLILVSLDDSFCDLPLVRSKFGLEAHSYWKLAPHAAVVVVAVVPGKGHSGVLPILSLSKIALDPVEFDPITVPFAPGP